MNYRRQITAALQADMFQPPHRDLRKMESPLP
jgi:hypothetical protein